VRVRVDGPTDTYVSGDRSLVLHRCQTCGCVSHWTAFEPGYDRMGVNARPLNLEVLAAASVRRIDGASFA